MTGRSSLDRASYCAAVETIRALIDRGEVYQVNVCRVLSAPSDAAESARAGVRSWQPASVALPDARVRCLSADLHVCSASPELFLSRDRVDGFDVIETRPIKGTGRQRRRHL